MIDVINYYTKSWFLQFFSVFCFACPFFCMVIAFVFLDMLIVVSVVSSTFWLRANCPVVEHPKLAFNLKNMRFPEFACSTGCFVIPR